MPPKHLSVRSRALAALRAVLGWDQAELAQVAGVPPNTISDYERGHRNLTDDKLDELAGHLGLPREASDWALAFSETVHHAAQVPGAPNSESGRERREIERISTGIGQRLASFMREILTSATAQSRAFIARQQARELWQALKRHPPARRRVLISRRPELRTWALCELICAESIEAAADNADRALDLAELALKVAELVPGERTWRERLQGYAWAHVGNAQRVRGDLPSAEKAFVRARKLWEVGSLEDGELLDEALVLGLEASLRINQSRLSEARALLDRALEFQGGAFRKHLLLNQARLLEWAGDFEDALAILYEAAPLISSEEDPRLLWLLRFHIANDLAHLGRFSDADLLLPEVRTLTMRLGNELDTVRLRWLEGRIAAGLGRKDEALVILSRVRSEFAARSIAYDTALATLEVASLLLEQGRLREVRVLARQMTPIFGAEGIHREALAALKLFRDSVEQEVVSVEIIRQMVEYFYRAENNPSIRFQPS